MEYEYAVEPEAIASSWNNCRFVMSLFGLEKGRLISRFPGGWFREVLHLSEKLPVMEKKRIQEKLISAKREYIVMQFSRPYDSEKNWIDNAVFEHEGKPFGGLIVLKKIVPSVTRMFPVEDIDEKDIAVDKFISKDVKSILHASHGFLRFGSQIEIIDPYFRLDGKKGKESRLLIKEFMKIAAKYRRCSTIKVHYKDHDEMPTIEFIQDDLKNFPDIVPSGMKLEIYRWRENQDCQYDFHGRYLLTDKGGIFFDGGFGGKEKAKKFALGRYSHAESPERLEAFTPGGCGHVLAEPGLRIHSAGQSERFNTCSSTLL